MVIRKHHHLIERIWLPIRL